VSKGTGLILSKRVLAIEDDQISRMLLMKPFLSVDSACRDDVVTNGAQATHGLETKKYATIKRKRNLQGISGLELISNTTLRIQRLQKP
jgi:hypothetical protein